MNKKAKDLLDVYGQLSASGRIDVLSYVYTVKKAESGIKKQYGLEGSPSGKKVRKPAMAGI